MTSETTIARAQATAARLRFEGATALRARSGETPKSTLAIEAGISRPTLDRWIASTEAGATITVDWEEPPARVTLRGVTVKVERRQVRVPDKTQAHAWTAETAWILTRVGEGPIDTMQQWDTDDRGGMILSQVSGSIAVFAAHLLDTALVLLAGGE